MQLKRFLPVFLGLFLLCQSISHPLKISVLYSFIPSSHRDILTDLVCNAGSSLAEFTAILPTRALSGFPTRCFGDIYRTHVLSEPERFQHIINRNVAKMNSFAQYNGQEYHISPTAAVMDYSDIVIIGDIPNEYSYIRHIIDMIPQPPFVIELSTIFRNSSEFELIDDFTSLLPLLLKSSGFYDHKKSYRFASVVDEVMECLSRDDSLECREVLPDKTRKFVAELAESARVFRNNLPPEYVEPSCYVQSPDIFGMGGLQVIKNIKSSLIPAQQIDELPRLMCFTYSYEVKHENVDAIRKTWGKKCDGYLAISNVSVFPSSILALGPDREESLSEWFRDDSYNRMWTKTQLIIALIATTDLIDDFDYFLLGGDDMYVLVDNLKMFLNSNRIKQISASGPIYIGRQIRVNPFTQFNSGGAGYVLNKAAALVLHRLIQHEDGICLPTAASSMEDLFVGRCLLEAGIRPIDTSNVDGREMFHPLTPLHAYEGGNGRDDDWYPRMALSSRKGVDCCSSRSISFHYIKSPRDLYCMEYLLHSNS